MRQEQAFLRKLLAEKTIELKKKEEYSDRNKS